MNPDQEAPTFFDLCWDRRTTSLCSTCPAFLPAFFFIWSLLEDCPLPSCPKSVPLLLVLVPRRCSDAGETYVDNDDEATCILNSDTGGYDYSDWISSNACPYPAGATEHLGQKRAKK